MSLGPSLKWAGSALQPAKQLIKRIFLRDHTLPVGVCLSAPIICTPQSPSLLASPFLSPLTADPGPLSLFLDPPSLGELTPSLVLDALMCSNPTPSFNSSGFQVHGASWPLASPLSVSQSLQSNSCEGSKPLACLSLSPYP